MQNTLPTRGLHSRMLSLASINKMTLFYCVDPESHTVAMQILIIEFDRKRIEVLEYHSLDITW